MTIEDFAKVYDFIGKDRGCFAILEKLYEDKDEFETIIKILPKEKRLLANGDTYGNGKRKTFISSHYQTKKIQKVIIAFWCIVKICPFLKKRKVSLAFQKIMSMRK